MSESEAVCCKESGSCCGVFLPEFLHKGSSSFCQNCFGFSAEIETIFLGIPPAHRNSSARLIFYSMLMEKLFVFLPQNPDSRFRETYVADVQRWFCEAMNVWIDWFWIRFELSLSQRTGLNNERTLCKSLCLCSHKSFMMFTGNFFNPGSVMSVLRRAFWGL